MVFRGGLQSSTVHNLKVCLKPRNSLYTDTNNYEHGGHCPRFIISGASMELLHTTVCCSQVPYTTYSMKFKMGMSLSIHTQKTTSEPMQGKVAPHSDPSVHSFKHSPCCKMTSSAKITTGRTGIKPCVAHLTVHANFSTDVTLSRKVGGRAAPAQCC